MGENAQTVLNGRSCVKRFLEALWRLDARGWKRLNISQRTQSNSETTKNTTEFWRLEAGKGSEACYEGLARDLLHSVVLLRDACPRPEGRSVAYRGGVKVKNSHIAGAVAAAPGSVFTPKPSSIRRRTLSCWYSVVD
jgi:hypothetical protein